GYRVLYQAGSEVVHFEGVSSGRSVTEGVKAYQVVNQQKFLERWRFALELHAENSPVHPQALTRSGAPRILIIDAVIPTPDKDAGSIIAFYFMKLLAELGYDITFIPRNLRCDRKYAAPLQELGIEILYRPYRNDPDKYIEDYGSQFDLFLLYRVHNAGGDYAKRIRQRFPETPVIFNTVDLHYLRLERQATLPDAPPDTMDRAKATKAQELGLIALCDDTVILSTAERDLLVAEGVADDKLSLIPLAFETSMTPSPRQGRNGIVFVGGYQHLPNVDAVLHFLRNIWPLVHEAMPDLKFHIVGSNAPPAIAAIREEGVIVHGFVADLDAFLDQRIASIAPLQYGAGIKGKIGSSLAVGLPCVATAVAVEGMGLEPGEDILVADSPRKFAEAIAALCRDDALWRRLSDAGLAFVQREYSLEVTRKRLFRLMAKNNVPPFSGWCPISGTKGPRRFVDEQTPDSLTDR
ncbi:MAG: glycosyltransferase family 4 protein, partial [Bauldia sp.]|nr:glycosyltransferase family 4 protein [Bauldia sp.]